MKDILVSVFFWVALLGVYSNCNGQTDFSGSLSMRNFTSSSIPIIATYDSLSSIFGDSKEKFVINNYRIACADDSIKKRYVFKEIHYPETHIAYLWVGDSVELLYILFEGRFNQDTIYYNDQQLSRTIRDEDIVELLRLDEIDRQDAFQPYESLEPFSEFATMSLLYLGNSRQDCGNVEFLFDKDGFLVGLYFAQIKDSIVYSITSQNHDIKTE